MTANSLPAIQERIREGKVTWTSTLIMTFVRCPLALLGVLVTYIFLSLQGNPHAFVLAVSTSLFHFTFANLICLWLLHWAVKQEGIRLRDLFGFQHRLLRRDILLGLALIVLMTLTFYVGLYLGLIVEYGFDFTSRLASYSQYYSNPNPYGIPLWYFWWGTVVFPLVNCWIEEMTFRGYAQPRLMALTNQPWLGILIMSIGFAVQHIAFVLYTFQAVVGTVITFFVYGLVAGFVYLKQKRLLPLTIANWENDFVGLGLVQLIQVLSMR